MADILEFVLAIVDMVLSFCLNIIMACLFIPLFILSWIFWFLTGCGTCGPYAGGKYPEYGFGFKPKMRYMSG
jgi:hypothetical protein